MPEAGAPRALPAEAFEAERARLLALATRVLADPAEAQDAVQQAWLRLHRARSGTCDAAPVVSLLAWLTTVTTRLCLDRLRARTPLPVGDVGADLSAVGDAADPADAAVLADEVGTALHLVLDRPTPRERVAFVLHDSSGFDVAVVAEVPEEELRRRCPAVSWGAVRPREAMKGRWRHRKQSMDWCLGAERAFAGLPDS